MPVVSDHFAALLCDLRLSDYRRLDAPVLYLEGRATRDSTGRIGELLQRALPHVNRVTLDAMGHLGPLTHPQEVAQHIAAFLRRRSSESATARRRAA